MGENHLKGVLFQPHLCYSELPINHRLSPVWTGIFNTCSSPRHAWGAQHPSSACRHEVTVLMRRVVWHRVTHSSCLFPAFPQQDVRYICGHCCQGQQGIKQGVKVRGGGSGISWQEISRLATTTWRFGHSRALAPQSQGPCCFSHSWKTRRPSLPSLLGSTFLSLPWRHCCPFPHQLRKCPKGVPSYIYIFLNKG